MPSESDTTRAGHVVGHIVGLGFGGNLGDPARQIAESIAAIGVRGIGTVSRVSSLWRTPPWGKTDQPAFLNACALIETQLPPLTLLAALQDIEREIGRTPGERWGPRLIDIDILFYGDISLNDDALTIPHKNLLKRAFVLAPLAEIAGDRVIGGRCVADSLGDIDSEGLERLPLQYWPQYNS